MYQVYLYLAYIYVAIILIVKYLIYYPIRCKSYVCLTGKTAVITGGNRGLGYSLALALASRGCRVIIGCRSDQDITEKKIKESTNNNDIVVKHLDLQSLNSVRVFAEEINKSEEKVDILVNNAGIGVGKFERTQDGLNPLMQTNHFGHFLLTHLLQDLLKKSAPSRIIFVSSSLSVLNNLTEDNLNYSNDPSFFDTYMGSYCNSKLCNLITANIFAKKLKEFNVTCNTVNPGLINTSIFRNLENIGFPKFLMDLYYTFVINPIAKDVEEGIQIILNAAIAKETAGTTGEVFSDIAWSFIPSLAKDEEFCKKIWQKSKELVQLRSTEAI